MEVRIRYTSGRRDVPDIMDIELRSFQRPWTEDDLLMQLRRNNCNTIVAEYDGKIIGFAVYELLIHELHILNLAVHPEYRRNGVGTAMVVKLLNKLSQQRRRVLAVEVRETNLAAQLFFRACGSTGSQLWHDYYEDTGEDAYRICFRVGEEVGV